ncbi:MAG: NADPH-dependent oxidoreductase, partial [Firmicutes bacterium]|nr:NADPH-dependent oxidoreductase [Bacillota bacterium]
MLEYGLDGAGCEVLETVAEIEAADLTGRRILFAIELGESGINLEYVRMLKMIRLNREMLRGSVAGIIVDGASELYTKSVSRHLEFSANRAGCAFLGRPLVEGTLSLRNYNVVANVLGTDNLGAYRQSVKDLVERLLAFQPSGVERPRILALHAGHSKQSNTLMLWSMIRKGIDD